MSRPASILKDPPSNSSSSSLRRDHEPPRRIETPGGPDPRAAPLVLEDLAPVVAACRRERRRRREGGEEEDRRWCSSVEEVSGAGARRAGGRRQAAGRPPPPSSSSSSASGTGASFPLPRGGRKVEPLNCLGPRGPTPAAAAPPPGKCRKADLRAGSSLLSLDRRDKYSLLSSEDLDYCLRETRVRSDSLAQDMNIYIYIIE